MAVVGAAIGTSELKDLADWKLMFQQIVDLTKDDSVGRFLSISGILMVLFGGFVAYRLMKTDPQRVYNWQKALAFIPSCAGILLVAVGPAVSLYQQSRSVVLIAQKKLDQQSESFDAFLRSEMPPQAISESLRVNKRVRQLIRLISYNPNTQTQLALERLNWLGQKDQIYTFVADYDEMKGYTAAEALKRSGVRYSSGNKISAIIFPADQVSELIPLNVRGLMQVIQKIEGSRPLALQFDVQKRLSLSGLNALKEQGLIGSWSWDEYGKYFDEYCQAAIEFRCSENPYTARSLIGAITHDWHPLGFSQNAASQSNVCEDLRAKERSCLIEKWPNSTDPIVSRIGGRVFMVPNMEINNIQGRILIDFNEPTNQKIPSLIPDNIKISDILDPAQ